MQLFFYTLETVRHETGNDKETKGLGSGNDTSHAQTRVTRIYAAMIAIPPEHVS